MAKNQDSGIKQVAVSSATAKALAKGHPWIIADETTRRWPAGDTGDLLHLQDDEGRFYGTALYDPQSRVCGRWLSWERLTGLTTAWLRRRLALAARLRPHVVADGVSAYRLINGEGDGLPGLTVDRYGSVLLVQYYSHIWQPYEDMLVAAMEHEWQPEAIFIKERPHNTRKLEAGATQVPIRLVYGEAPPEPLLVAEGDLTFAVRLQQGLHTGLFLDQRENRGDLRQRVAGCRVLNLFAYTGAFSVAALAGGAQEVVSVDAAARYCQWAEENCYLNGFVAGHRTLTEDAFSALQDMRETGERFDFIVADPPSFATTRKSRFQTRGGTGRLVAAALAVLAPEGFLVLASNHQRVDWPAYLQDIHQGAQGGNRLLRVVHQASQSGDFPFPPGFTEGRYLKYVVLQAIPSA